MDARGGRMATIAFDALETKMHFMDVRRRIAFLSFSFCLYLSFSFRTTMLISFAFVLGRPLAYCLSNNNTGFLFSYFFRCFRAKNPGMSWLRIFVFIYLFKPIFIALNPDVTQCRALCCGLLTRRARGSHVSSTFGGEKSSPV